MSEKNSSPKTPLKLVEIAQELRRIADDLEKQTLNTGTGRIHVGEPTFLKTRSELKNNTAYFSLSIRMDLAGSTRKEDHHKKSAKPAAIKKERGSGSGEAKKIKKEINRLWKDLRRATETKECPAPADGKELLRLWEEYTLFAEASWADAWKECKNEVMRCLQAAAAGDWTIAQSAVKETLRLTKECHRQHK